MLTPPDPDRWSTMETEVHAWRRERPDATWTEIEQEVDRQLDRLRAQLLGEVVTDTEVTATCPSCGHAVQARGTHDRTIITDGGEEITLTRSYQTCPVCGGGLFPP
jgi:ribosomal protein S27AE